ncbi:MAG: ATP-binding protein [Promethearchaeota archaeon]|jgi:ferredoxin
MLRDFPSRVFESKFDKTLKKIPALGKLLSSLFGLFEFYILETFRKLDNKFNIYTMGFINKYILRGRWGGRVVPLNKNISIDVKFIPSQEILEILHRSKVVGIGECYCRAVQRKHGNDNCEHPLHTCIHFGPSKSLYEIPFKSTNLKRVSKNEINQLLEECDERGLLHQLIYFPNPQFYYIVCNCCPCCCVVLSKFLEKGSPQMIKSDFFAETDDTKCVHCGTCIKECHFKARTIRNSRLKFDSKRCFGCGLCVSKCPHQAIELIKKE